MQHFTQSLRSDGAQTPGAKHDQTQSEDALIDPLSSVDRSRSLSPQVQAKGTISIVTPTASSPPSGPTPVQFYREGYKDRAKAAAAFMYPTWNEKAVDRDTGKKGAWVDARSMRYGDDKDARQFVGIGTETNTEKQNRETALQRGRLSIGQIRALPMEQAKHIDPLDSDKDSNVPRNILKHTFKQSWNRAKHTLVGHGAVGEVVMKKIWEYRQWHHDAILRETQAEVGTTALAKWSAAGSTSLTSDIDVNMKGEDTERAVGVFNKLFKADGWDFEAGVVYDVNVYALDFMFPKTFDSENPLTSMGARISGKEAARTGNEAGGVDVSGFTGKGSLQRDLKTQEVWSLVKMRLYMTGLRWTQYKASVDPKGLERSKWDAVENKYDDYIQTLRDEMTQTTSKVITKVDEQKNTGAKVLADTAKKMSRQSSTPSGLSRDGVAENIQMAASNRIYEKKLKILKQKRVLLASDVKKYNTLTEDHEAQDRQRKLQQLKLAINSQIRAIRDLVSECALYANEAYVTDGGVQHAVVGIQAGIGIHQMNAESFHAFNENVADSLKEMARHNENVGEACYKAGKYMWRMADAARNMGANGVTNMYQFYEVGFALTNTVKGGNPAILATNNAGKMQTAGFDTNHGNRTLNEVAYAFVRHHFNVQNSTGGVDAMMSKIRVMNKLTAKWYNENVRNKKQEITEPQQQRKFARQMQHKTSMQVVENKQLFTVIKEQDTYSKIVNDEMALSAPISNQHH